jgi:hypothetical protein
MEARPRDGSSRVQRAFILFCTASAITAPFQTVLAIGSSVAPGDIYDELDELANGEGARRQCLLVGVTSSPPTNGY